MCAAFTAQTVVAHKGSIVVAFTCEEEKETPEKKSTDDKISTFYEPVLSEPLPASGRTLPSYEHGILPAGYHHTPFNPPDAR